MSDRPGRGAAVVRTEGRSLSADGSQGPSTPAGAAARPTADRPAAHLAGALADTARDLYPGSFALVMATGIVSIASHLVGLGAIAWALLALNVVVYLGLLLLFVLRLRLDLARLCADLADRARGPGFFTLVAGTCVLGTQSLVVAASPPIAVGLAMLGLGLWLGLSYAFFTAVAIRRRKPSLERGLNGSWLLAVVSTQAAGVLGAVLAPELPATEPLLLVALALYLLGCLLYVALLPLVVYRLTFVRLTPAELTPDYWITMGAAAITTLAGATLVSSSSRWSFLADLLPFLMGFTLLFWAAATWWIPLLIALEVWRARSGRHLRLASGPEAWARVFPLGMYATATLELARVTGLSVLQPVGQGMAYVALLAWLLTGASLLRPRVFEESGFAGPWPSAEPRPRERQP